MKRSSQKPGASSQNAEVCGYNRPVDALLETLDAKLREWKPETAAQVRECVSEIISLADQDGLDLLRSRAVEQEVLDSLDDSSSR